MAESDGSKHDVAASDQPDLPLDSMLTQIAAYDERLRQNVDAPEMDRAVEALDPQLTKAIRALRDVLVTPSPTDGVLEPGVERLAVAPIMPERFQMVAEIGSGAFGIVYQVYDLWLKRDVAIKFLRPELLSNAALRQRFLRESRAAARLSHPYIVRVLEVSESADATWQLCELVSGASLTQHLRQTRISVTLAARLVRDLADALAHAHENNVLHRDIKPDNILIDRQPGEPLDSAHIRLTDFGLARLTDLDATQISCFGMLVGTPRYMAPEQLTGKIDDHGPGTDIYAIGIVLYELLSGQNPFASMSSVQERITNINVPLPSVRKLCVDAPKDLVTICDKCLETKPQDRFASAADLRDDLDRFLRGDPTLARPLPIHEQIWRWSVRHQASAAVAAILILTTCLVLVLTLRNNSIYRKQNLQLSAANSQLTFEEQRARELAQLTEELRRKAVAEQTQFEELAWQKGIREAYSAWHQKNYAESRQLLDMLVKLHPEAESRVEWRLLREDIAKQVKPLLDLDVSIDEVRAIPNSTHVAAAAANGNVYLIDVPSGQLVDTIQTGVKSLHALAISRDGRWLATGGSADIFSGRSFPRIYDLTTRQLVKKLPGMVTTVESLEFSHDAQWIACGSRYRDVKLLNIETGESVSLPASRRNTWMSASPDGKKIAVQATETSLWVADFQPPFTGYEVPFHSRLVTSTWTPDSASMWVAAHFADGSDIFAADNPAKVLQAAATRNSQEYTSLAMRGDLLAGSLANGSIAIWNDTSSSDSPPLLWQLAVDPITSVTIQDQWLIAASYTGELIGVRLAPPPPSSKPTFEYRTFQFSSSASWSNSGQYALIGRPDGSVQKVELPPKSPAPRARIFTLPKPSVATDETVGERASEQVNHKLEHNVDDSSNQPVSIAQGAGRVVALAISPDNRKWARAHEERGLVVTCLEDDHSSPIEFFYPQTDNVSAIAFSPDSSKLAWTGNSSELFLAAIDSDGLNVKKYPLSGRGACLAWSAQGDLLAVGAAKIVSELRLDIDELSKLADHGSEPSCLVYTQAGKIYSGHRDGTIRLLDRQLGQLEVHRVHNVEVRNIMLIDNARIGMSMDLEACLGVWFADQGDRIGLIENDLHLTSGDNEMPPALWINAQSELRVLYNDLRGDVLVDSWKLAR
ncbi:MAG: protein kinase [Pirellulaceae bacterium]|nr:protein kinase [Pirellulaceae bacterium]